MSSTISRYLEINYDNVESYCVANTGMNLHSIYGLKGNVACWMKGTTECSMYLNADAMTVLYPNAVVHPIKADVMMRCLSYKSLFNAGTATIRFRFDGTAILNTTRSSSSWGDVTASEVVSTVVKNSNRASNLTFCLAGNSSSTEAAMIRGYVRLYFTLYDFAATAGTGISSVSVSSDSGFDGDRITYSCSLQAGATFIGWYKGSTLVSTSQTYTLTVNGADVTLTAVAQVPEKDILTVSYGTRQLIRDEIIPGTVDVTYNGTVIVSVGTESTKTLLCSGKLMAGAVTVNGHSLKCGGKVMEQNIVISNTRGGS